MSSGCAIRGPKFTAIEKISEGEALVYIYRKSSIFGAANVWALKVNDSRVAIISNGSYQPIVTSDKQLSIYTKRVRPVIAILLSYIFEKENLLLTLDVELGKTYFFKWKINPTSVELIQVDEWTGMKEIKKLRLAEQLKEA
ncbi:MAG: hypothetical protein U9P73_09030 [Candidatus Cloacimonadota bacterium]|nr:hypothetical protein [Candidatus Cloacimonadota bacterium]